MIEDTERINQEVLARIEECEELRKQVKDRTTDAYLQLLDTMRIDYEKLNNEDKLFEICKEIEYRAVNSKSRKRDVSDILLASYDSRARMGDFRAYCIALEWNRPIEKQFFIPRKRVLEKHGLIQAMQDMADDKLDFLFVSMSPRVGKALSNSTPILTKEGWKTHGELQVGDYVLNDKGRFVKVLATSCEYPCDCRVTFSNREQIVCHENHDWVTIDNRNHKECIVETSYLFNNLMKNSTHRRFSLKPRESILGEYKDLKVHPYVLGAYLGDGNNRQPRITGDKQDKIIAETFEEYGYPIRNIFIDKRTGAYTYSFNNLAKALHNYDMCYDSHRTEKHIPNEYFTASIEQRLQLLAGLLDTDGYLLKNRPRYNFSTVSEQLRDDFVKLVSTFGWRTSVTKRYSKTHTINKLNRVIVGGTVYYEISFNVTSMIPCRVPRKQLNNVSNKPGKSIFITNVERLDNLEMGKCIQVEGGIYLAGKTLIPTHNSTLGLFFLTFMAGRFPDRSILGNGHSASLTQSFYNECLNVMTSEEYRYNQIFPTISIAKQSAEYSYIDLNNEKRFHTIMFRSIDGATTGLAEASNVLYCDDLVKDIEQANNPDRLQKLFETYTSTVQDRKVQRLCKDGKYRPCPEIHIATRWSLNDPIGRLISIYGKEENDRMRIINIPCYDESGESNFMYDYGKGFDKDYYHHLEMAEDPVTFAAKYLGQPIEREGRPFTDDQLSFFYELPEEKPDRIIAYCDVAHGGEDYLSLPIGYQYGYDIYIEDVLFVNKLGDTSTRPLVCDKLIQHKVTRAGFEENNGGKLYADWIIEDLRKRQYRCNITTHKVPTTKSKLDRIMGCQNEIKGVAVEQGDYRIFFKAYEQRKDNKEYCDFMKNLNNWSQKIGNVQKSQHDDAPDSLAGLVTNILTGQVVGRASSHISLDKLGL